MGLPCVGVLRVSRHCQAEYLPCGCDQSTSRAGVAFHWPCSWRTFRHAVGSLACLDRQKRFFGFKMRQDAGQRWSFDWLCMSEGPGFIWSASRSSSSGCLFRAGALIPSGALSGKAVGRDSQPPAGFLPPKWGGLGCAFASGLTVSIFCSLNAFFEMKCSSFLWTAPCDLTSISSS